jgi:hypothetical protein
MKFDAEAGHLQLLPNDWRTASVGSLQRLAAGDPPASALYLRYGWESGSQRVELRYLSFLTALELQGPDAGRARLPAVGLADSLGAVPDSLSVALSGREDPGLRAAFRGVFSSPLTARPHRALADTLASRKDFLAVGAELRAAMALGSGTGEDHLLLGFILAHGGSRREAAVELRRAIQLGGSGEVSQQARTLLRALEGSSD